MLELRPSCDAANFVATGSTAMICRSSAAFSRACRGLLGDILPELCGRLLPGPVRSRAP